MTAKIECSSTGTSPWTCMAPPQRRLILDRHDARSAGHMVMAAQADGLDALRLSHALLRALRAEGRDITDPAAGGMPTFFHDLPEGELRLWDQDRLSLLDKALPGEPAQAPEERP